MDLLLIYPIIGIIAELFNLHLMLFKRNVYELVATRVDTPELKDEKAKEIINNKQANYIGFVLVINMLYTAALVALLLTVYWRFSLMIGLLGLADHFNHFSRTWKICNALFCIVILSLVTKMILR